MEEKLITKVFKLDEKEVEVKIDLDNDTVWMIQSELAKLFDIDRSWIAKQINKDDLDASTCANLAQVASNGKVYEMKHYSLEIILKIGYKLDASKTIQFKELIENSIKELKLESVKNSLPIEVFEDGDFKLEVSVSPKEDTVWLTQKQIALLFDCSIDNVSLHLKNIVKEELEYGSVVEDSSITAQDGKQYVVKKYNLDAVIAVGYRVGSKRGLMFRRWANKILKQYLSKGYVIDENRVILYKDNYLELNNTVLRLENKVVDHEARINVLEEKKKEEKVEKIFFNGEEYDAFSFLSSLVSKATSKIILIDNYIDVGTLDILSYKKSNVDVEIITVHDYLTRSAKNTFIKQYGNLTIKINPNFHDRFLIIDNTYLYLIGASIKDAGIRSFCVSEMSNQILNDLLLKI